MSKLEKSWKENLRDSHKYILVDTNNFVIGHFISIEDATKYKNESTKTFNHVRIYKEVYEETT